MKKLLYLTILLILVCKPLRAQSDTSSLRCLTEVVYQEAPEESTTGKLAVATVVMNRTHSRAFPHTVCGVVYQRGKKGCQFSWVCGHRIRKDSIHYAQAEAVAHAVLFDSVRLDAIKKAVYFHNVDVWPKWMQRELTRVAQIGRHIFYAFPSNSRDSTDGNI